MREFIIQDIFFSVGKRRFKKLLLCDGKGKVFETLESHAIPLEEKNEYLDKVFNENGLPYNQDIGALHDKLKAFYILSYIYHRGQVSISNIRQNVLIGMRERTAHLFISMLVDDGYLEVIERNINLYKIAELHKPWLAEYVKTLKNWNRPDEGVKYKAIA